jgi:hypothetical protein
MTLTHDLNTIPIGNLMLIHLGHNSDGTGDVPRTW